MIEMSSDRSLTLYSYKLLLLLYIKLIQNENNSKYNDN